MILLRLMTFSELLVAEIELRSLAEIGIGDDRKIKVQDWLFALLALHMKVFMALMDIIWSLSTSGQKRASVEYVAHQRSASSLQKHHSVRVCVSIWLYYHLQLHERCRTAITQ
jgi:hypothetical protein